MIKKFFKYLKYAIIIFFASSIFFTVLYRFVPPPFTPLMIIRLTEQIFGEDKIRLKKDWVSIDKISPNLALAVIASEDQNFTTHYGFDFKAIKKVYSQNKKRKRIKGASTISQQTAKNVFLWPGRSWIRKGFEVYFTLLIETIWNKERILEVYLNVAEMGKGIYGAEAASRIYFNKSAKKLTKNEAALIAAVIPNPRRWNPTKPTPYILKRQAWILRNMGNMNLPDFK